METDLEKSDRMICNTRAFNTFSHKKQNDLLFYQTITNPIVSAPFYDVDIENKIKAIDPRLCVLSTSTKVRGGNAIQNECDTKPFVQGYDNFAPYYLDEYLLTPCMENTFRNHLVCDEDKCCSLRHQLFMNITKRK